MPENKQISLFFSHRTLIYHQIDLLVVIRNCEVESPGNLHLVYTVQMRTSRNQFFSTMKCILSIILSSFNIPQYVKTAFTQILFSYHYCCHCKEIKLPSQDFDKLPYHINTIFFLCVGLHVQSNSCLTTHYNAPPIFFDNNYLNQLIGRQEISTVHFAIPCYQYL